eukprot:49814_1
MSHRITKRIGHLHTKKTALSPIHTSSWETYALSAQSKCSNLRGKTIFITGGSRGIGLAIALKCAEDGGNIIIAAKTAEPHPKLPSTIYSAAKQIEAKGSKCLPVICDIRKEEWFVLQCKKQWTHLAELIF